MRIDLRPDIDLLSLDVFDTVLGRRWPQPAAVFEAVGHALRLPDPSAFRVLRAECELELRRAVAFRAEVQLQDICAAVAQRLSDRDIDPARLAALELEAERRAIFAVPALLALLARARERRLRVAFVSDSYLPEFFLAEMLDAAGARRSGDLLLVSSAVGVMKSTGGLFRELIARSGLPANRIQHIGDNAASDVRQARQAGLQAMLVTPTAHCAGEFGDDREPLAVARVRGAMRAARLAMPPDLDTHQQQVWTVSATVAGPLIAYLVRWCAQRAAERGIKRLYFMARDGQIMHRVAQASAARELTGMELRYLQVSRQALLLPAIDASDVEAEMDWILARTHLLTPRIALRRVNITPEEVGDALAAHGIGAAAWDLHMGRRERDAIRTVLTSEARPLLLERAETARQLALGYLQQEGLFSESPFALVDVGWNGTLQRSIGRLLAGAGRDIPTTGLYLGLRSHKKRRADDVLLGCLADVGRSAEFDAMGYIVPLIELFASADHGGVIGYERRADGHVRPLLNPAGAERLLRWGIDLQQKSILAFERELGAIEDFGPLEDWRALVMERLTAFASAPTREQAQAYGRYEDAEDQNESYTRQLAAPLSMRDALRFRTISRLRHHNEWAAGSLALSSPLLRLVAGAAVRRRQARLGSAVFGPGVEPLEGFGAEEGPYVDMGLPRFVWAYGPRAVMRIPARDRPMRLSLAISTLFPEQHVDLELAGQVMITRPVAPGDAQGAHPSVTIVLPLPAGKACSLALRPHYWSDGERPLALIVVRVTVEDPGAG